MMSEVKNERVNSPPSRAGMLAALHAMAMVGGELRYNGFTLVFYNLVWFVASLPVITMPPATAALYVITHELSYRRTVTGREFFEAMRTYGWVSWRWMLLNVFVAAIIFVNITFYRSLENVCGLPLIVLWIGLSAGWIAVQMYCFPVLLEQIEPSLRTALRNALVLGLRHPFFTLTIALVAGLVIVISVIAPFLWALITTALLAFIYNRAVYYLVQIEQGKNPSFELETDDTAI